MLGKWGFLLLHSASEFCHAGDRPEKEEMKLRNRVQVALGIAIALAASAITATTIAAAAGRARRTRGQVLASGEFEVADLSERTGRCWHNRGCRPTGRSCGQRYGQRSEAVLHQKEEAIVAPDV